MPSRSTEPRSPHRLKIAHLYPDEMDLYGDTGNLLALVRRCEWRDIRVEVVGVRVGEPADIADADLVLMGGGQDAAQAFVAPDLAARGAEIRDLVEGGAAVLAVCGGFQLFGRDYTTSAGVELAGIGIFDARTVAGPDRIVGNTTIEARLRWDGAALAQPAVRIVGFENHSGRTYLGASARPLGRVVFGAGNAGDGGSEGAVYRNAIGTYLHGPLLPKNPVLADHLILAALAHRYGDVEPLASLDDTSEMRAHRVALSRCENGRTARRRQPLAV